VLYILFISSNYTSTPDIYPLSLHDALPISNRVITFPFLSTKNFVKFHLIASPNIPFVSSVNKLNSGWASSPFTMTISCIGKDTRSEEHTSELQSRFDLVCRLLLEKKKTMK